MILPRLRAIPNRDGVDFFRRHPPYRAPALSNPGSPPRSLRKIAGRALERLTVRAPSIHRSPRLPPRRPVDKSTLRTRSVSRPAPTLGQFAGSPRRSAPPSQRISSWSVATALQLRQGLPNRASWARRRRSGLPGHLRIAIARPPTQPPPGALGPTEARPEVPRAPPSGRAIARSGLLRAGRRRRAPEQVRLAELAARAASALLARAA